jgi:predicted S18 family serine protease
MHHKTDENRYQNDIFTIGTVYDSVYYAVRKDPVIIKWLNDNLIKCMTVDFMENQSVKNEAESEISDSWANMIKIPNNASIKEIEEIIKQIEDRKNENF